MIINLKDKEVFFEDVFLAESAMIIGDVCIGKGSSIWYNSVLRGDVAPIIIGKNTNIQDLCVLHGTYNKCGVNIGDKVSIGHSVILHGCDIGNETLVGMGSIIMDNTKIGNNCIVGAGSLVTENKIFDDKSLILGRPARAIRKLSEEEIKFSRENAEHYLNYRNWYESS